MTFRSRIAPTPSGFLHTGNLYSFLLTWLWTRLNNGQLLLRIDDMDGERCRDEYLLDIFDTLNFFDLSYDEGPASVADFKQNFTQANRLDNYYAAIEKLKLHGKLYACICSRRDVLASRSVVDPLDCKSKQLPLATANAALRINIENNTTVSFKDLLKENLDIHLLSTIPDFAVQQKNGLPAYQVCSLADDLQSGVTHIVRGEDLLPSTAAQLYLAALLGEEQFQQVRFLHHPLIKKDDGGKLSKSAGDTSIKAMRSNGFTLKQVLQQIIPMFGILRCEAKDIHELLQFIIAHDDAEIGIFAKLKAGS